MIFGGLQKFTLIDYPGKLAATIFLGGCNFRCPFCYNPELVLPDLVKNQKGFSEKEIINFLNERKGMLDGVVICGGEPTIEKELPDFIQKIKNLGYSIKLDTNGSNPAMLFGLIKAEIIDYVAMDIKATKEKYQKIAGVDVDIAKIEDSIYILKTSDIDYEFRTTIVPLMLEKQDIISIAQWIKPAKKYVLQQFKNDKNINPEFSRLNSYSVEYLIEIKEAISPFFENCQIRA